MHQIDSTRRFTYALRLARVLAMLMLLVFGLYVYSERLVDLANARRQQLFLLADELRQSSDDLTRMVRTYVMTGDARYKREFEEVLAIRNGLKPRPAPVGVLYWDLLPVLRASAASAVAPQSLLSQLEQAGADAELMGLLTLTKGRSDELARIEKQAMAVWESGPGTEAERRLAASAMLHDAAYHEAKANIMVGVDAFNRAMDARSRAEVSEAILRARALWILFAGLTVGLLVALGMAYRSMGRMLGGSVAEVYDLMGRLGRGDFKPLERLHEPLAGSVLEGLEQTREQLALARQAQAELQVRQQREQELEALRGFIMERLTSSIALELVMHDLVLYIENLLPGTRCSILLLDDSGQHLRLGAAPSLPDFYNQAVEGLAIGPTVGSCGAAIFLRHRVVVENIATHPNWAPFASLAAQAELGACWSEPIRSGRDGVSDVLGSFAMYRREPATPSQHELDVIETAASLTAMAIERKRAELQLQLLSKVFEHGSELIMIADAKGRLVRVNQAFTAVTGYTEAEALGRNPNMLSSGRHDKDFYAQMWAQVMGQGQWAGEVWNRRKDGSIYPSWLAISVLRDQRGLPCNFVAIASDITQRKAAEERIRQLAEFDALTGLPNRRLLQDRVETAMGQAKRQQQPLALIFLDLDRFKNVNDSLGHQVGDALLVVVAQRLQSLLREQDTVSRIGGDEFVLLCPNTDAAGAAHVANHVLTAFQQHFHAGPHELACGCSLGVAMFPADAKDYNSLLMAADAAMYRAKQSGRHTFCFFTAEMQIQTARTLELESGLRRAIELAQLQLVYQPQVDLKSGRLIGAEALLRWQHPVLGQVSPAEFIPVAEDCGLIVPIGEWVLRKACEQMRRWLAEGLQLQCMAVNLSLVQFRQADLADRVALILGQTGLLAQHLELEITEGVAMDQPQSVVAAMDKLHALGVRIAIDDFGTGYSSLSYLKRLKLQKLKIDQSFVRDISDDADDRAIVSGIISLARSLGYTTIAEGIETQAQWDYLQEQGCDEGQGYLISRPLAAADFLGFALAGKVGPG